MALKRTLSFNFSLTVLYEEEILKTEFNEMKSYKKSKKMCRK